MARSSGAAGPIVKYSVIAGRKHVSTQSGGCELDLLAAFSIAVVVALLGFLVCYLLYVRPLRGKLSAVSEDLAKETALSVARERDYEARVAKLSGQAADLKSQIARRQSTVPRERAHRELPVNVVRIVVSWTPGDDDQPEQESGIACAGAGADRSGRAAGGHLAATIESRGLERGETDRLSPVIGRCREYLASGYNAEGFTESIRDTVAERLADPLYVALSRDLPVPPIAGLALAGRDLEDAAAFITRGAERPLETAEHAIGIPDLDGFAAGIGAAFVVAPVARPLGRAAVVCEVTGFVVGAVTGAYPLMAACGKLLMHREMIRGIKEGIAGVFREGSESRAGRDSREGRDFRGTADGADASRRSREAPGRRPGEREPAGQRGPAPDGRSAADARDEIIICEPHPAAGYPRGRSAGRAMPDQGDSVDGAPVGPAATRGGLGRETPAVSSRRWDRDEPGARWDGHPGRFSGPSRGGR